MMKRNSKISASKKAQIERWIVIAVVCIIGAVLLIALFVTGLLPKGFEAIMNQLVPPTAP